MEEKNLMYRNSVIKELYFAKTLSCADLSGKIGKSLPLTAKILAEMIEEGDVVETGYAASTGGRKPVMYSMKPDIMFIVSVAMDQFVTRIIVADMQGNYVTEIERFELHLSKEPQWLYLLGNKIEEVIRKSGIKRDNIAGIGIGMPGFVDAGKGINYSFPDAGEETITGYIAEKTGVPVYIDNDSTIIALAELKFGAARHKKNAMVVNIGWGIGLGLIVNGELFRGHNGFAGEFSHIPLFLNGKLCSCGKTGCLETETSLLIMAEKAKEGLKAGRVSLLQQLPLDSFEEVNENLLFAAVKGDRFAVELLSEAGYNIGRGVAILIHLFNPELVVLSGRGSLAGKIWQAPIQQALNEHCIPRLASNTEIEISEMGYEAELIGAAALVMENYRMVNAKNISFN
ncbi:Sugar kinase of the NBD/HSP70 family, may contain an N-terminal HTH domain [Chitinophaga sp. CF118]|uniref:ROK family protein n=1 Tax=Chitinophaga sp. CF118 TaxID=1884367 RepID=UPI0008F0BAA6|nr:ROK family protein [Chitinophaga sp. CF118]SFD99470.1 Sugar kinase of the NBD/HSP70 family, may contain an N-terminal HTH domain [Chitinophaga sp. CF118]